MVSVSKVGTPADNQVGVWTGDGTIEGTAGLTFAANVLGVGTGATGTVTSNGDFDLTLKTGNATTGNITITDGADGDITLAPNGNGSVIVDGVEVLGDTISTGSGSGTISGISYITAGSGAAILSINDQHSDEILRLEQGDNANVNEITIAAAVTTASPEIMATGNDTNIGIALKPKGTGNVYVTTGIELGHATDTTISRVSAGVIAVEGATILTQKNLIRYVQCALNGTTALTTSEKAYFRIPAGLTGMNLVSVAASVGTGAAGSSSSGTPTFTVRNVTDNQQMLSTSLTVDASEYTSATAAAAAVIDTTKDDVVSDDLIEVAVTTAGTGTLYAQVVLGFQLP
jgi:hypothetical protein